MKTIQITILAILAVAMFAVPFAVAQETTISADSTGIADLGNSASGLQIGLKQAQIWFTFNQEKKADLEIKLAELRLVQAKVAAKNGNIVAVQNALEAHDRIIAKVQARIDKLDGANEPEKVKASYGQLVRLQKAIETHEARIETLKNLIVDESLTDEQRNMIQEKMNQVEANTAKLSKLQLAKEEQVKTRLRAVTTMNEAEINAEVAKLEGENGLTEARRLIAENKIRTTEQALIKIREKLQVEKQNSLDVSAIESQIATASQSLSEAKALYTSGKFEEAIATLKPVSNYGRNMKLIVNQVKESREAQNTEKIRTLVQEAQAEGVAVREQIRVNAEERNQLVGNDADEHGCIGSAGYSWCEAKQKCLRAWEESCAEATESGSADAGNADAGSGNEAMAGNQ